MRWAQNPGNMLNIGRAFANVSTSALLKNWNRIEVGTSNSFETLRAHALRTSFSEWALAVGHVHSLVCDAHDNDSSNAGPGAQESSGKQNIPLALSLPLTLNTGPAERNPMREPWTVGGILCQKPCRTRPVLLLHGAGGARWYAWILAQPTMSGGHPARPVTRARLRIRRMPWL